MKRIRLTKFSDSYFQEAWALYEDAFPIEERRSLVDQFYVLKNNDYHFDILIDDSKLIGFILWWDFEMCRYIDHFATSKKQRNKGIGKLILNKFIDSDDKPIILEVELPTSKINERRIIFYERIGFKLKKHHYNIPSQLKGQFPLELLIMSYPTLIADYEVEQFVEKYHPVIFNNKL